MAEQGTGQVAVMMAVYNGEPYLDEQIRSILAQTYGGWTLYISDDGSSDATWEILERYAAADPGRIFISRNDSGKHGAKHNFGSAMQKARGYRYYMFSDQDDLWDPEKISVLAGEMKALEERYGDSCPLLTYSDLEVVGSNASPIHPSFIRSSGLALPKDNLLQQFLLYNCIPGCAMLFNDALRRKMESVPDETYMHDWWLALIAASVGKISLVDRPLMKYRQHSANSVGTIEYQSNAERLSKYAGFGRFRRAIANNREMKEMRRVQASRFLEVYGPSLDDRQKALLAGFIAALGRRKVRGAAWALRNGFVFMNRLYTLKFFLL